MPPKVTVKLKRCDDDDSNPLLPQEVVFKKKEMTVGRGDDCDIRFVNDRTISKLHCSFALRSCKKKNAGADGEVVKRLFVKDLSTYGTFVNGKKLAKDSQVALNDQDVVRFRKTGGGDYTVVYEEKDGHKAENQKSIEGSPRSLVASSEERAPEAPARLVALSSAFPSMPSPVCEPQLVEPMQPSVPFPKRPARPRPPLVPLPQNVHIPQRPVASGPPIVNIQIPTSMSGVLIGKGGETLRRLIAETKCMIEVPTNQPDVDRKTVALQGSEDQVEAAKKAIEALLSNPEGNSGHSGPSSAAPPPVFSPTTGAAITGGQPKQNLVGVPMKIQPSTVQSAVRGETTIRSPIEVPANLVGVIIGRGGETIRALQEKSGAKVEVAKEGEGNLDPNDRLIICTGNPQCVEKVHFFIKELLFDAEKRKTVQEVKTVKMEVPQNMVGLVIGRGGDTIRWLQQESQCKIEVAKEPFVEPNAMCKTFFCQGYQSNIDKAKELVDNLLNPKNPPNAMVPGGMPPMTLAPMAMPPVMPMGMPPMGMPPMRPPGMPNMLQMTPEVHREILRIPIQMVGLIIGSKGETIKKLGRESGAKIEVMKEGDDDEERAIVMTASQKELVVKAKEMVEQILLEDRERPKLDAPKLETSSGGQKLPAAEDKEVACKIYVDELLVHCRIRDPGTFPIDGRDEDCEIFLKNLPAPCGEQNLWELICSTGAKDVKEILMLREQRNGQQISKGMAYVLFERHADAVVATKALHMLPAERVGGHPDDLKVEVYMSESERLLNMGLIGKLMGQKAKRIIDIEQKSAARKVYMTGKGMTGHGKVDNDTRLHLVIISMESEVEQVLVVTKATWQDQLYQIYDELSSRSTWNPLPNPAQQHMQMLLQMGMAPQRPMDPMAMGQPPLYTAPPPQPMWQVPAPVQQLIPSMPQRPAMQPPQRPAMQPPQRPPVQPQPAFQPHDSGVPTPPVVIPPPRPARPAKTREEPTLEAEPTFKVAEERDELSSEPRVASESRQRSRSRSRRSLSSKRSQVSEREDEADEVISRSRSPTPPRNTGEIRIPIVMKRRTAQEEDPRVESTYLVGRELAWGEWAKSEGDLDWRVIPLRWGDKGDLFSMCVHRRKKKMKICCTDASQPFSQWPEVACPDWPVSDFPRWIPFTAKDEHSHMLAQHKESITIFHIPSPAEPWVKVGEGPRMKGKAMAMYCPKEKSPYILERGYKHEEAKLWRIKDNKELELVGERRIPKEAKIYPVAVKTATDVELFVLYVAKEPKTGKDENEGKTKRGIIGCLYIPREGIEEPWHEVARHSIPARDTKLLILYIPGKQEPMAMSLSASTKTACLCKLNLTNCLPPLGRSAKDMEPARIPVVEPVSDRRLADVFAKHPLKTQVWQLRPTDCTADLLVSKGHPWITADLAINAPAIIPDTAIRPPFDPRVVQSRPPYEPRVEPRAPFDMNRTVEPHFEPRPFDHPFDMIPMSPFEPRPMPSPFDVRGTIPMPTFDGLGPRMPFEGLGPRMPFADPARALQPRGFEAPAARGPPIHRGDAPCDGEWVEINFQEQGVWYPGAVLKIHEDGTYDVEYDDGSKEHNVRPYNIRGRGLDKRGKGKGKGKGKKGKDKGPPPLSLRGADRFESWDGPKSAICVDNDVIGLIIGSGGDTIRRLEDDTNAKITVAKDSSCAPDDKKRMIYVTGDTEEVVENARQKVCEIRDSATKRKPDRDRSPKGKGDRRRSGRRARSGRRRGPRSRSRRRSRSARSRPMSRSKRKRSHSRPGLRMRSRSKRERSRRNAEKSHKRSRSRRSHKEKKRAKKEKRRRKDSSRSSQKSQASRRSEKRVRGLQAAITEESERREREDSDHKSR